jgi:hypothetical protein
VSPFTQYFVRKLLRRYLAQPQSLTPYLKVADPDRSDLTKVLRSLCANEQKFQLLLYELESLVETHTRLESQQSRHSPTVLQAELARIELRIQQLLGLRLSHLLPQRLPKLLPENATQPFRFCWGKQVQSGVFHHDQFYGLLQRWQPGAQLQAYQMAWTLAQRDVVCLLTRSTDQYALWINLKNPTATVLLQQSQAILPQLLKLSPTVCRRLAIMVNQ